MSNNKQDHIVEANKMVSSVEYLATQILDNWNDIQAGARNIDEFIEQAKAMHKEEMIDALLFGDVLSLNTAENYYNETFGGNNEQYKLPIL